MLWVASGAVINKCDIGESDQLVSKTMLEFPLNNVCLSDFTVREVLHDDFVDVRAYRENWLK